MAARSSSVKNTKKSKKQSTKSQARIENLSLAEARRIVQSSYTMHLVLLVIMTALAAFLLVVVVKQQYTIDSLEFQVRFMRQRYEQTKDWNGELLENKFDEDALDDTLRGAADANGENAPGIFAVE